MERLSSFSITKGIQRMIQYLPFIGTIFSKAFGSKAKRDKYQAQARDSVYSQFASEFGHSRTAWDSLIDGINRMPRPLMTFGVVYLFYMCWSDPEAFVRGAEALQYMPKEGWYILGAIVTFWFAARLPKDFGKYKPPKSKNLIKPGPASHDSIGWDKRKNVRYKNLND